MSAILKAQTIASEINIELSKFYGTIPDCEIKDFVYLKNGSSSSLAETVIDQSSSEVFLGILISKDLVENYDDFPCPSKCLRHDNIALFSIIAEEVSHFRQLYFIARSDQQISKFDLELQSEFDKFIAAMFIMHRQTGDFHSIPLARLIFDSAATYSSDEVYERFGNLAAQWWWHHLNNSSTDLLQRSDIRRVLKEIVNLHGEKKSEFIKKTLDRSFFKSA